MKKTTKLKSLLLSLLMLLGIIAPTTVSAQRSDGFFKNFNDNYEDRTEGITGSGIQNDPFGVPLGSGLLILTAIGAGYAVAKRRRNKGVNALVLVIAIILFMPSCRKKIVEPVNNTTQTNGVNITLNVGDGSKADVNPPHVSFKTGDQILVAYDGKYVGTITHNGTFFSGNIDATGDNTKPLYFYFLGNKDAGTLTAGTTTSCTVNISDQTGYPTLPVISFSASDQNFTGAGSYTASLHNKASLMKFSVTTPSNSPICITGMNNKVIIDFTKATNDAQNNGFTYDKEDGGIIKLKGGSGSPATKWAIVLPQDELAAGSAGSIYAQSGTYTTFNGTRPTIHAIEANGYYHEGGDVITMTVNTATEYVDLGDITANTTIATGKILIGTLANNVKISIADGATVTLSGVTINGVDGYYYKWAGLDCLGDVTINLADGTTNTVKGFHKNYPGIHVPAGSTLTIQGTGALDASSNGKNAGIGSGYNSSCGNIVISGGTIAATGGQYAAGIGSGYSGSCGTVTISGGNVNATGGQSAAGIGSGYSSATCGAISINGGTVAATGGDNGAGIGTGYSSSSGAITISGGTVTATGNGRGAGIGTGYSGTCADGITIANTVTSVTATKGGSATNSIGAGFSGTCGTVTIGGDVGAISTSPYTYEPIPGALTGKFTINASGDQVYFSQGNLQATYNGSSWSWAFATNQWNYVGNAAANTSINGNGTVSSNGTVDLFGWVGASSTWTGVAQYGISNSTTKSDYGNVVNEALKSDWGNTIGTGWRTLTKDEWLYVFNTRTSGSTVNGTSNARYTHATINTDGTGVNGMILFPDGVTIANGEATSWGTINGNSAWGTQCTSAEWTALAAKGCVFLPAAGFRNASVSNVGSLGLYWSSTPYDENNAYDVYFSSGSLGPEGNYRYYGFSVRLVRNAN